MDQIVRDFMAAVCGPDAAIGACEKSVVQQLSTMPGWMYEGGMSANDLPTYAWNTTDPFNAYAAGRALKDPTCKQMARYFARLVGWYTNGGFHDECGHWHQSGYNYTWWGISVLNEDEHNIRPDSGQAYCTCFDAIKTEVKKVNSKTVLVGPEIAGRLDYFLYFLNASHHADGQAPPIASYHQAMSFNSASAETAFTQWDSKLESFVRPAEAFKKQTGQKTEFVLNEYIPFVGDYCDCLGNEEQCGGSRYGRCPSWQDPRSSGNDPNLQHAKGIGMNKVTTSWHASAAVFAYGYATLAEYQYKYVGQDQLIGGTWPDNEPGVSCMDWQSGQPNAKYWVTQLLAKTVGDGKEKTIMNSNFTATHGSPPPPPGATGKGTCGETVYKDKAACDTDTSGAWKANAVNISNLSDCVTKVSACKMGNYASFSISNNDCSWYADCNMSELDNVGANYESEVIHPGLINGAEYFFAMPYIKDGAKGFLLINKKAKPIEVMLHGVTAGAATIVEYDLSVSATAPALNPPVARKIGSDGSLRLGAFGTAIVRDIK